MAPSLPWIAINFSRQAWNRSLSVPDSTKSADRAQDPEAIHARRRGAEREKQMAAYDLLDGFGATTNVRIPAILSETTSGHLDAVELLTCLAGLAPHGVTLNIS